MFGFSTVVGRNRAAEKGKEQIVRGSQGLTGLITPIASRSDEVKVWGLIK